MTGFAFQGFFEEVKREIFLSLEPPFLLTAFSFSASYFYFLILKKIG